ncbi:MAG: 50S ribosomal protein L2 [Thermomicrobiales bacterium]
MPVKKYKPTTPGRRGMSVSTFEEITKTTPEKKLIEPLKKHSGRNNQGRVTVRHRGGGHKRMYRLIDFKRNKIGVAAKVVAIEYDPNRTSRIALVQYEGSERYILHPVGLQVGDTIMSGPEAELRVGNALPLRNIPLGTQVHNVELNPGQGGKMIRQRRASAQVLAKAGEQVQLRMPSGRSPHRIDCKGTIGQVGNIDHQNITLGKAGAQPSRPPPDGARLGDEPARPPARRWRGRTTGGQPKTPWGKPAMGRRTRHNKSTDKFIVRRQW